MTPDRFEDLLDELVYATCVDFEVSVCHATGLLISVLPSGAVMLEDTEDDEVPVRHRLRLERAEILQIMREVAAGDLESLEARHWELGVTPWGYGY